MKYKADPEDRLLTRAEVAKIFQVSPSTVTRWAEAGKLPAVKTLGGHRRYEASAVMKLAKYFTPAVPHQSNSSLVEEPSMEKITISAPAMYGDHHVVEVRRILLETPGVEDVYASSCFQAVEVTFDPTRVSIDEINSILDEAGYLEELPVPAETGIAVTQRADQNGDTYFRHTAAFEQAKDVISFAQDVDQAARALWPCPGVGVIKVEETEKERLNG